jgi:hypothetical protein
LQNLFITLKRILTALVRKYNYFLKYLNFKLKHALQLLDSVSSFIWIHPIGSSSLNENSNLIGKSSANQYSKMDEEDGF